MKPFTNSHPQTKPFLLGILVAGLLIFSIGGWMRLFMSIQNWTFLQTLNLKAGPFYLITTGFFWGGGALVCAASLWLEKRWSIYLTAGFITIYTIWYWFDRLVMAQSSTANTDILFSIIATIFWLFSAGAILFTLFQRSHRYNDK